MSLHEFLKSGVVSEVDLQELIRLTEAGHLMWIPAEGVYAYFAGPFHSQAPGQIGPSFQGARIGYNGETSRLTYVRLDNGHFRAYADDASTEEILAIAQELYQLTRKAVRLGGRLASEQDEVRRCEQCGADTPHRALVDRPYGLAGAVMGGSERLTCTICEHSTPLSQIRS